MPRRLRGPVVAGQDGRDLLFGPGVQLLDPHHGDVFDPSVVASDQEVEGDFSGSEDDATDFLSRDGVVYDLVESPVSEFFGLAVSLAAAQVPLGGEKDERLAGGKEDLAAQAGGTTGRP